MKTLVTVAVFGLVAVPPMLDPLSNSCDDLDASEDFDFSQLVFLPSPITERLAAPESAGAITPARASLSGSFCSPYGSHQASHRLQSKLSRMAMKTIASALLALSILAGIARQANAADASGSTFYEQPVREIR